MWSYGQVRLYVEISTILFISLPCGHEESLSSFQSLDLLLQLSEFPVRAIVCIYYYITSIAKKCLVQ